MLHLMFLGKRDARPDQAEMIRLAEEAKSEEKGIFNSKDRSTSMH